VATGLRSIGDGERQRARSGNRTARYRCTGRSGEPIVLGDWEELDDMLWSTMKKSRKRKEAKIGASMPMSIVLPRVVGEPSVIVYQYSKSRISEFASKNRLSPTPAERRLKRILNSLNGGVLKRRFTFQHVISGKWIVDFFFPEIRLAIEVDGISHQAPGRKAKDGIKQQDCDRFDITLLRISNKDVFGAEEALVAKLRKGWTRAKSRKNKLIGLPHPSA
jgi:very-short-patch-repair endonuclease